MSAQSLLDPIWLSTMMQKFANKAEAGQGGKQFVMSSPPRVVDIVSRQGIDVSASPYKDDGGKVKLFASTSPAAAPVIPSDFILTQEPRFEYGQPTNNSTMLGFLALGVVVDGVADAQENGAMLALSSAFIEFRIANTVVGGPITVGEYLGGPAASQYGGITGSIGKGAVRNDRNYYLFGDPLVVMPQTTSQVTLTLEGSAFAANSVTNDPRLTVVIKSLVADGQYV